jgi:hypothetical protein
MFWNSKLDSPIFINLLNLVINSNQKCELVTKINMLIARAKLKPVSWVRAWACVRKDVNGVENVTVGTFREEKKFLLLQVMDTDYCTL